MADSKKFKLSVKCYTFNQSQYITDTMNGFCIQNTNFPYVCCIVDDASTDGEQNVIQNYLLSNFKSPELSGGFQQETDYAKIFFVQHKKKEHCYFAVLLLKENHYRAHKPKIQYLEEWRKLCEFEAVCEGDDFWIDPGKLQKQVNILEQNQYISLVHTGYNYLKGGKLFNADEHIVRGEDYFEYLLNNPNPISTPTVCYRISLFDKANEIIPEKDFLMGDLPLWIALSIVGKIYYLRDVTATYRLLETSASHSKDYCKTIAFFKDAQYIRLFFAEKYNKEKSIRKIHGEIGKYDYLLALYNLNFKYILRHLYSIRYLTLEDIKFFGSIFVR